MGPVEAVGFRIGISIKNFPQDSPGIFSYSKYDSGPGKRIAFPKIYQPVVLQVVFNENESAGYNFKPVKSSRRKEESFARVQRRISCYFPFSELQNAFPRIGEMECILDLSKDTDPVIADCNRKVPTLA